MTAAAIAMPDVELRITINRPHGYRIRMALMIAALWIADRVSPSCIDVQTEIKQAANNPSLR